MDPTWVGLTGPPHDDCTQEGTKKQIDDFDKRLEEWLDDKNFIPVNEFDGACLDDIVDNVENNVIMGEQPKADDKDAINECLNTELIVNVGTSGE